MGFERNGAVPRVEVAARAGACYGVERALDLTLDAAKSQEPVHTLGPLIHNPRVVADLEEKGVGVAASLDEAGEGTVIIRSHGVVPEVVEEAKRRGNRVVDATCPYVKSVHAAAQRLVREGYRLVIVGEAGHPEVEGIVGHAGGDALVVADPSELQGADLGSRVGVVVQTTQSLPRLQAVVSELVGRVREVHVVNTICSATSERQASARALAARADAMVVIGGRNSGNTRRLFEICSEECARTFHIEDEGELDAVDFAGASLIGVTAGASTPASHIDAVIERLHDLLGAVCNG